MESKLNFLFRGKTEHFDTFWASTESNFLRSRPHTPGRYQKDGFTNSLCFGISFELWKFGGPSSQGPCEQNHWNLGPVARINYLTCHATKWNWLWKSPRLQMAVSENSGIPKSSILIGVFHCKPSILGCFPIFGNTQIGTSKGTKNGTSEHPGGSHDT